jgi:hypothetical protein
MNAPIGHRRANHRPLPWLPQVSQRRGREAYRSDESVLGCSAFVEAVLREAEEGAVSGLSRVGLSDLETHRAHHAGIPLSALASGSRRAATH